MRFGTWTPENLRRSIFTPKKSVFARRTSRTPVKEGRSESYLNAFRKTSDLEVDPASHKPPPKAFASGRRDKRVTDRGGKTPNAQRPTPNVEVSHCGAIGGRRKRKK